MKRCKSVHIDRPIITAETQPIVVTTIPSQCGGRLRRASVLNVWMPMATMKKNEAYSPISLNDPKQRQSFKNLRKYETKTVNDTLSGARCPYDTRPVRSPLTSSRDFEAVLLT
jgi:hypothetical protein